jgi:hypothetical protein
MPAITQAGRDYEQAQRAKLAMAAEEDALRMQKLRFDIEKMKSEQANYGEQIGLEIESKRLTNAKAREEETMSTPIGRAGRAGDIAAFLEQEKQKDVGIPLSEQMGSRMIEKGGPSILEATKMQGELDVEARARQARIDAAKNYLAGEKSLLPTASIDLGGVKQTVLAGQAGKTSADIYGQIYRNQVPQVAATYEAEGFDRDTAIRMASQDVRKELVKASTGGKVVLTGADGLSTISYSNEQAERMWRDPKTPKAIRDQLNNFFGQSEEPAAANWIKTRLGR